LRPAALATIFSVYLSNSAQALAVNDTGLKAEALVSASLELTTYQFAAGGDKARPALGSFRFRLDNADVLVSFTSEAARIDLNFASKRCWPICSQFRRGSAGRQGICRPDRWWRTRPKPTAPMTKRRFMCAAGLGYSPRQSLFTHERAQSGAWPAPILVDRACRS